MKVLLLTLFLLSIAFGKELSPEERQDRSIEEQENGQPPEPERQCLELDTAMPGNDLDNGRGRIKDVASWIQCDAYCMEENDCKFWTYQVKNGNCFLKTSDANRKSDKNGAISGSSGCSTEVRIEFKLINALTNQPIESVPVEVTRDLQGPISVSTDAEGLAEFGPFVPGESITVKVSQEGFDDIEQVIIADEDAELILLAANPTATDMRLVMTWGSSPSDLDSHVRFFDANGNEQCHLYYGERECDNYATLDVDQQEGGNNGPETISITEIPDGFTALYYVFDFSNKIGSSMSWKESEGKSTIFSPSGGGSTVVTYDNVQIDDGKRYIVVGCFGSAGYSEFSAKGKATTNSPSLADCQ